jgi:effector-binding domain-containing protein
MEEYAKKHGLVLKGPVYNTYLHDELSISDPQDYLMQAVVLVEEEKKKKRQKEQKEQEEQE